MQQAIGTYIRQRRRERNMTQSELGGTAFSKSYVSAVEGGKLLPSKEALKHFAASFGESEERFMACATQMTTDSALPLVETVGILSEVDNMLVHEKVALLEAMLEQIDYTEFRAPASFFSLSEEALALLSRSERTHYAFFQGMMLQKQASYPAAIQVLEGALAGENHPQHVVAILHELGACYMAMHLPHTALAYSLRAHQALTQEPATFANSPLSFRVELACGAIYQHLCRYSEGLKHFEQARICVNTRQNMQQTGQLYWGLGYCTYALAFQQTASGNEHIEQIEQLYQQACSYLLQSCILAQIALDKYMERSRRLFLTSIQLDWCIRQRRQLRRAQTPELTDSVRRARLLSTLDEISQQCRQMLLDVGDSREHKVTEVEGAPLLSMILTLLVRSAVQRALLQHESGYESTFQREYSFAVSLCQQILDAGQDEARLERVAWSIGNLSEPFSSVSPTGLPRLSEFTSIQDGEAAWIVCMRRSEVFWMAGEVAIMQGQTASMPDFRVHCIAFADRCFQQALTLLTQATHQEDLGYLERAYQRYVALLEERLQTEAPAEDLAQVAGVLLALCKKQFAFQTMAMVAYKP